MTGQELALRQQAASVPPALRAMGVVVAERDGVRQIEIPAELRERVNVLTPRSALEQADPLWQPALRMVQLSKAEPQVRDNPNPHWYLQQSKPALTKNGLMELCKLAGIEVTKTERMPRSVLRESEIGWSAEGRVRQSDGTFMRLPNASKVIDREEEYQEIMAQSGNNSAKAEKRWIAERKHLDAKCETKAILRLIRAALALPGTFNGNDWQKPFLVVAYNFTPDYSDAEVRRMLTAAGASATEAVYGSDAASDTAAAEAWSDTPEPADVIDVEPQDDDAPEPPDYDPEPDLAPAAVSDAERAGDHMITWGQALNGKRIRELSAEKLLWLCELPTARGGVVESQRCAREYSASLPVPGEVR
jgi:hypothetical protein